ncbi:MAG: PEGA domain-containing protein [Myxococcales bacterium]|nr:PEGA domain-containing protein [Myxococcales bacterium]MBK7198827.1 PEGA domain-containing protein [Myxococcales bacterium]MBP6844735.1 PEGA domain-containing protein [Kofleriaceae bacterium]
MRDRGTRALLAGALALGLARPAAADRVGAVVVRSTEPAVDAVALTAALAAAGVAEPEVVDATAAARALGTEPRAALAGFAAVEQMVSEGWRAYVAADPEFAAARLAAARTAAEALLTLAGGLEVYADASLRLGVTLLHLGQREAAARALRLAHALDPGRPVTASEFTPDAVDAFTAAIAATPPAAEVRIDALAGAEVAIDGAVVGAAPLVVTVATGPHVVVVRHPRYQPRALAVELGAATPLLSIELVPDRAAVALAAARRGLGGLTDDDLAVVVEAALTYAEVDEVVLVASIARAGAPALVGQRCVGGRACTAIVEVGYADARGLAPAIAALRERLARAEPRFGVVLPADPRVTRAPIKLGGGGRAGRRRWYWIGGGAVAVAAAVTAALWLTATDGAPVVSLDPGDFTGR